MQVTRKIKRPGIYASDEGWYNGAACDKFASISVDVNFRLTNKDPNTFEQATCLF